MTCDMTSLKKIIKIKEMENNRLIAEFMGYKNWLDAKYHKSWKWLNPVVDKIEKYLFKNTGKVGYFDECLQSNDREVRYQAVIEFIKFYNQNK